MAETIVWAIFMTLAIIGLIFAMICWLIKAWSFLAESFSDQR